MIKFKKFYVTTPIYYVNDVPHIGHAYTTIAADILARWHRMKGENVFFLTGLDEHGQKIEEAALEMGLTPQELVNSLAPKFKKTWENLNISNDDFIRTTEERHAKVVTEIIKRIYNNGDIYKGEYEGWYCVPCESFWTELQLVSGKCPECGRDVKKIKEETYFFKLSKYQQKLLDFYNQNPEFISPETRKNEMVNRVKEGLKDISITRTTVKWAIPFPFNEDHYLYVWIEALINYISALDFPDGENFKTFWPPDVELIGKEINWFHSVVWPAMLFSARIEPPKKNFVHGWWTVDGKKMSKSLGNVIDPNKMIEKYGTDALRYYLFREVPFGQDGDFSENSLIRRYNTELADSLGNLVNRVLVLVEKNFEGFVPKPFETKVEKLALNIVKAFEDSMERFEFNNALNDIFFFVNELNKYVNEQKPWEIKDKEQLCGILYSLLEGLRIISILIYPFMPESAGKIMTQLGLEKEFSFDKLKWGVLKSGTKTKRDQVLFNKIK